MESRAKKDIERELRKAFVLATSDNDFVKLANSLDIEEETLLKNTTKLQETIKELHNCKNCKSIDDCKNRMKGCVCYPFVKEATLIFSYTPCKLQKQKDKETKQVTYFETSSNLKNAKMSEIFVDDKARIEVIKYLKDFIKKYGKDSELKGLYLHGSFGCGKSYMISALLNELGKQGIKCINVYYPNLLKKLKSSFKDNYDDLVEEISNCDVLLLDDIGAENNTTWARDEILGSILQHRMDNNLTTFFTSNFNINELESHLSETSSSTDKIKARRIIERIKQLTNDIELIGENRR